MNPEQNLNPYDLRHKIRKSLLASNEPSMLRRTQAYIYKGFSPEIARYAAIEDNLYTLTNNIDLIKVPLIEKTSENISKLKTVYHNYFELTPKKINQTTKQNNLESEIPHEHIYTKINKKGEFEISAKIPEKKKLLGSELLGDLWHGFFKDTEYEQQKKAVEKAYAKVEPDKYKELEKSYSVQSSDISYATEKGAIPTNILTEIIYQKVLKMDNRDDIEKEMSNDYIEKIKKLNTKEDKITQWGKSFLKGGQMSSLDLFVPPSVSADAAYALNDLSEPQLMQYAVLYREQLIKEGKTPKEAEKIVGDTIIQHRDNTTGIVNSAMQSLPFTIEMLFTMGGFQNVLKQAPKSKNLTKFDKLADWFTNAKNVQLLEGGMKNVGKISKYHPLQYLGKRLAPAGVAGTIMYSPKYGGQYFTNEVLNDTYDKGDLPGLRALDKIIIDPALENMTEYMFADYAPKAVYKTFFGKAKQMAKTFGMMQLSEVVEEEAGSLIKALYSEEGRQTSAAINLYKMLSGEDGANFEAQASILLTTTLLQTIMGGRNLAIDKRYKKDFVNNVLEYLVEAYDSKGIGQNILNKLKEGGTFIDSINLVHLENASDTGKMLYTFGSIGKELLQTREEFDKTEEGILFNQEYQKKFNEAPNELAYMLLRGKNQAIQQDFLTEEQAAHLDDKTIVEITKKIIETISQSSPVYQKMIEGLNDRKFDDIPQSEKDKILNKALMYLPNEYNLFGLKDRVMLTDINLTDEQRSKVSELIEELKIEGEVKIKENIQNEITKEIEEEKEALKEVEQALEAKTKEIESKEKEKEQTTQLKKEKAKIEEAKKGIEDTIIKLENKHKENEGKEVKDLISFNEDESLSILSRIGFNINQNNVSPKNAIVKWMEKLNITSEGLMFKNRATIANIEKILDSIIEDTKNFETISDVELYERAIQFRGIIEEYYYRHVKEKDSVTVRKNEFQKEFEKKLREYYNDKEEGETRKTAYKFNSVVNIFHLHGKETSPNKIEKVYDILENKTASNEDKAKDILKILEIEQSKILEHQIHIYDKFVKIVETKVNVPTKTKIDNQNIPTESNPIITSDMEINSKNLKVIVEYFDKKFQEIVESNDNETNKEIEKELIDTLQEFVLLLNKQSTENAFNILQYVIKGMTGKKAKFKINIALGEFDRSKNFTEAHRQKIIEAIEEMEIVNLYKDFFNITFGINADGSGVDISAKAPIFVLGLFNAAKKHFESQENLKKYDKWEKSLNNTPTTIEDLIKYIKSSLGEMDTELPKYVKDVSKKIKEEKNIFSFLKTIFADEEIENTRKTATKIKGLLTYGDNAITSVKGLKELFENDKTIFAILEPYLDEFITEHQSKYNSMNVTNDEKVIRLLMALQYVIANDEKALENIEKMEIATSTKAPIIEIKPEQKVDNEVDEVKAEQVEELKAKQEEDAKKEVSPIIEEVFEVTLTESQNNLLNERIRNKEYHSKIKEVINILTKKFDSNESIEARKQELRNLLRNTNNKQLLENIYQLANSRQFLTIVGRKHRFEVLREVYYQYRLQYKENYIIITVGENTLKIPLSLTEKYTKEEIKYVQNAINTKEDIEKLHDKIENDWRDGVIDSAMTSKVKEIAYRVNNRKQRENNKGSIGDIIAYVPCHFLDIPEKYTEKLKDEGSNEKNIKFIRKLLSNLGINNRFTSLLYEKGEVYEKELLSIFKQLVDGEIKLTVEEKRFLQKIFKNANTNSLSYLAESVFVYIDNLVNGIENSTMQSEIVEKAIPKSPLGSLILEVFKTKGVNIKYVLPSDPEYKERLKSGVCWGLYDNKEKAIYLPFHIINADNDYKSALHEMFHAITSDKIKQNKELIDTTKALVTKIEKAIKYLTSADKNKISDEVKNMFIEEDGAQRLYDHLREKEQQHIFNKLLTFSKDVRTNEKKEIIVQEFITHFMTDSRPYAYILKHLKADVLGIKVEKSNNSHNAWVQQYEKIVKEEFAKVEELSEEQYQETLTGYFVEYLKTTNLLEYIPPAIPIVDIENNVATKEEKGNLEANEKVPIEKQIQDLQKQIQDLQKEKEKLINEKNLIKKDLGYTPNTAVSKAETRIMEGKSHLNTSEENQLVTDLKEKGKEIAVIIENIKELEEELEDLKIKEKSIERKKEKLTQKMNVVPEIETIKKDDRSDIDNVQEEIDDINNLFIFNDIKGEFEVERESITEELTSLGIDSEKMSSHINSLIETNMDDSIFMSAITLNNLMSTAARVLGISDTRGDARDILRRMSYEQFKSLFKNPEQDASEERKILHSNLTQLLEKNIDYSHTTLGIPNPEKHPEEYKKIISYLQHSAIRHIFAMLQRLEKYPNYEIVGPAKNTRLIPLTDKTKNSNGYYISSLRPKIKLDRLQVKQALNSLLFGNEAADRIKIGFITDFDGKGLGIKTKTENVIETCYKEDKIFLMKFEDKNTSPLLDITFDKEGEYSKATIFQKIILPLYAKYVEMGLALTDKNGKQIYKEKDFYAFTQDGDKITLQKAQDEALVFATVMRILIEEMKYENYKLGERFEPALNSNMITIMKRATMVLENSTPDVHSIANQLMLLKTRYGEPLISFRYGSRYWYYDGGPNIYDKDANNNPLEKDIYFEDEYGERYEGHMLYQRCVFMDTETLKNKLGISRFDGGTIILIDDERINRVLYGSVNPGTKKNIYTYRNMQVKHAEHCIDRNSLLGKWMLKNNIGAIIPIENEKHGVVNNGGNVEGFQRYKMVTPFQKDVSQEAFYIPFNEIQRIQEKYNTHETTRGNQQIFNSSGFTKYNEALADNPKDREKVTSTANKIIDGIINNFLKKYESNQAIAEKIGEYALSIVRLPQGSNQKAFAAMFPELSKFLKESKEQGKTENRGAKVYNHIKGYLGIPTVFFVLRDYITQDLLHLIKYEVPGSRTTLSMDYGDIFDRDVVDRMRSEVDAYNAENPNDKIKAFDDEGFLNRDFITVSSDIAKKHNLKIGDYVQVSVTPTAGSMEIKGCRIGGITIAGSERQYNAIVMNSEYVQGIGRDYDIDEMNLAVFDNSLGITRDEWNEYCKIIMNTEKVYINKAFELYQKLGINQEYWRDKDTSNLTLNEKFGFIYDKKTVLEYMQKQLGAKENAKTTIHPASKHVPHLSDIFHKNVGFVIIMRQLHQFLTEANFNITIIENKEKKEINVRDHFFQAHLVQMYATQHQVDYPKDISKDFYNDSEEHLFANMFGLEYNKLDKITKTQLNSILKVLKKHLVPILRIPAYNKSYDNYAIKSDNTRNNHTVDMIKKGGSLEAILKDIEAELMSDNSLYTKVTFEYPKEYPLVKVLDKINEVSEDSILEKVMKEAFYDNKLAALIERQRQLENRILIDILRENGFISDRYKDRIKRLILNEFLNEYDVRFSGSVENGNDVKLSMVQLTALDDDGLMGHKIFDGYSNTYNAIFKKSKNLLEWQITTNIKQKKKFKEYGQEVVEEINRTKGLTETQYYELLRINGFETVMRNLYKVTSKKYKKDNFFIKISSTKITMFGKEYDIETLKKEREKYNEFLKELSKYIHKTPKTEENEALLNFIGTLWAKYVFSADCLIGGIEHACYVGERNSSTLTNVKNTVINTKTITLQEKERRLRILYGKTLIGMLHKSLASVYTMKYEFSKGHDTGEASIQNAEVIKKAIAKSKAESYKDIMEAMTSKPYFILSKDLKKENALTYNEYTLEIYDEKKKMVYVLYKNGKEIERKIGALERDTEIHKMLTGDMWENPQNRFKIEESIILSDPKNLSFEEREEILFKYAKIALEKFSINYFDANNEVKELTLRDYINPYSDYKFTFFEVGLALMLGMGTKHGKSKQNLFIPVASTDNQILYRLIARSSPRMWEIIKNKMGNKYLLQNDFNQPIMLNQPINPDNISENVENLEKVNPKSNFTDYESQIEQEINEQISSIEEQEDYLYTYNFRDGDIELSLDNIDTKEALIDTLNDTNINIPDIGADEKKLIGELKEKILKTELIAFASRMGDESLQDLQSFVYKASEKQIADLIISINKTIGDTKNRILEKTNNQRRAELIQAFIHDLDEKYSSFLQDKELADIYKDKALDDIKPKKKYIRLLARKYDRLDFDLFTNTENDTVFRAFVNKLSVDAHIVYMLSGITGAATYLNPKTTSSRGFGLMSLAYAKQVLLDSKINQIKIKIQSSLSSTEQIIEKVNQIVNPKNEQKKSLAIATKVMKKMEELGRDNKFEVYESENIIYYAEKVYDQVKKKYITEKIYTNLEQYIDKIAENQSLENREILKAAIALRTFMDVELQNTIKQAVAYMNQVRKDFIGSDYEQHIEEIVNKYRAFARVFKGTDSEDGETVKLTFKIFERDEFVKGYIHYNYARTYERLKERGDLKDKDEVEIQIYINEYLEKQALAKVGNANFYVPSFSNVYDNFVPGGVSHPTLYKNHFIEHFMRQLENDITTTYYLQTQRYAIENNISRFTQKHLLEYYRMLSTSAVLHTNIQDIDKLTPNQIVYFYTTEYGMEEAYEKLHTGRFVKVENGEIIVKLSNGTELSEKIDRIHFRDSDGVLHNNRVGVWLQKGKLKDIETKIQEKTASLWERTQYGFIDKMIMAIPLLTMGTIVRWSFNVRNFLSGKASTTQFSLKPIDTMIKMKRGEYKQKLQAFQKDYITGATDKDIYIILSSVTGMGSNVFDALAKADATSIFSSETLTLFNSYKENIQFLEGLLKDVLAKDNTYKKVEEEITKEIEKIKALIAKGNITAKNGQKAILKLTYQKNNLKQGYYRTDYKVGEELVRTLTPETLEDLKKKLKEGKDLSIYFNLEPSTIRELIKQYKKEFILDWNFKLIRNTESKLRSEAFMVGYTNAIEMEASKENAVIAGIRMMQMTQGLYTKLARQIGHSSKAHQLAYSLYQYTGHMFVELASTLDEAKRQQIEMGIKSAFPWFDGMIKLAMKGAIRKTEIGKVIEGDPEIAKEYATLGDNVGKKIINIWIFNGVLMNLAKYVGGLEYMMNPVVAPWLLTLQFILNLIDSDNDEDDPTVMDLRLLIAQWIARYAGIGIGVPINIGITLATGGTEDHITTLQNSFPLKAGRVGVKTWEKVVTANDNYMKALSTTNFLLHNLTGYYVSKDPFLFISPGKHNAYGLVTATSFLVPGAPDIWDLFVDNKEIKRDMKREAKKDIRESKRRKRERERESGRKKVTRLVDDWIGN